MLSSTLGTRTKNTHSKTNQECFSYSYVDVTIIILCQLFLYIVTQVEDSILFGIELPINFNIPIYTKLNGKISFTLTESSNSYNHISL